MWFERHVVAKNEDFVQLCTERKRSSRVIEKREKGKNIEIPTWFAPNFVFKTHLGSIQNLIETVQDAVQKPSSKRKSINGQNLNEEKPY